MTGRPAFITIARIGFLLIIPAISVLIVAGVVAYWGFGVAGFGDNFIILADREPVPERRIYGLVAVAVPTGFMLAALWRLFQMFRAPARHLMGPVAVGHLRSFALFSIYAALSAFLLSGVMRWAMGVFDVAPLWTHLGFSLAHGAVLFGASIVYVATHQIEEGYAYKRETEEYV